MRVMYHFVCSVALILMSMVGMLCVVDAAHTSINGSHVAVIATCAAIGLSLWFVWGGHNEKAG